MPATVVPGLREFLDAVNAMPVPAKEPPLEEQRKVRGSLISN
jgi:hypothetical protein